MTTIHNTNKVIRFDSPEVYCAYLRSMPEQYKWSQSDYEFAGDSYEDSLNYLTRGHDKNLKQAQQLIEQMRQAKIFTPRLPLMQSAVVGGFVNVPAAINGYPKAMFRRQASDYAGQQAPLRIYVETLVSGGVSQEQLTKRGIAILGFVLAMNIIRPVEVYAVAIGGPDGEGAYGSITRLASKPMDLKRACFMLTDPAFYRRLAFSSMRERSKRVTSFISWAWQSSPTSKGYVDKMRDLCQCNPQDIFIKGGYLLDQKMLKQPIEWVKDMIKTHSNVTMA